MDRALPLRILGVLGIVGGGIAVWYSFNRQMCTMAGGVEGACAPNIVYLIPGLLAALVGISLVVFIQRQSRPNGVQNEGT